MSPLPQDVSEYDKQVGQNLSRVRSEKGISRTTLSDAAGLQLQTIEDYENGRSQVALDALIKISRCLAVPMSVLFDGMDMALPKSEKAPLPSSGSESAKSGATGVVLTGEEIQTSINLIRQQMGSKLADRITDLIEKASNT